MRSLRLTQNQMVIWALVSQGFSITNISEKLKTTRQYVNQTRLITESKLTSMLLEVAEVNDLQVKKIDPSQAILLGYSLALQQRVIVTYTTSHGLKVWYWHENLQNVNDPDLVQKTMQYLTDIAKERGIAISKESRDPAKLSQEVFCKLIPELRS